MEATPKPSKVPVGDQTDGDFLPRIFDELAHDHYSAASLRRFCSQAWQRAMANVRARPRRRAATLCWIGLASVLAAMVLVVGTAPLTTVVIAGLWFAALSGSVYIHQGLVRHEDGTPYDGFLIANGLTYIRLALAPLLADPVLRPGHEDWRLWFMVGFGVFLIVTDQIDGLIARGLDQTSQMGRMLDPAADLAVLTFLAVGLARNGIISDLTLVLVLVRYPGMLIGVIILTFACGPRHLSATLVGKATMWLLSGCFILAGGVLLLAPAHSADLWMTWMLRGVTGLLIGNIIYFSWVAITWSRCPRSARRGFE